MRVFFLLPGACLRPVAAEVDVAVLGPVRVELDLHDGVLGVEPEIPRLDLGIILHAVDGRDLGAAIERDDEQLVRARNGRGDERPGSIFRSG